MIAFGQYLDVVKEPNGEGHILYSNSFPNESLPYRGITPIDSEFCARKGYCLSLGQLEITWLLFRHRTRKRRKGMVEYVYPLPLLPGAKSGGYPNPSLRSSRYSISC